MLSCCLTPVCLCPQVYVVSATTGDLLLSLPVSGTVQSLHLHRNSLAVGVQEAGIVAVYDIATSVELICLPSVFGTCCPAPRPCAMHAAWRAVAPYRTSHIGPHAIAFPTDRGVRCPNSKLQAPSTRSVSTTRPSALRRATKPPCTAAAATLHGAPTPSFTSARRRRCRYTLCPRCRFKV
jgi:hypothetical protein